MKLRHILLFLMLFIVGFVAQQFLVYLTLTKDLVSRRDESARFALLIDKAMYEENTILRQLNDIEQQHQQLRARLPAELGVEQYEKQLRELAGKLKAKVLATRVAILSRPLYREARVGITLESDDTLARRYIRQVQALPRIIKLEKEQSSGSKLHGFTIAIYAAESELPEEIRVPSCIELPRGLVLPPLTERLTSLHADYSKQCNYVANYNDLYLKLLRVTALQEEVKRLKTIIPQIDSDD